MDGQLGEDQCNLNGKTTLKKSGYPVCITLKNSKNKILFFSKKQEMAVFEEMTDGEIEGNAPWTQFMLQYYLCGGPKYLVALSVKDENKSYLISSKSDKELQFKESDFPDKIEDNDQDILFWLKRVIVWNKIEFESFLYPEHYLACEEKENNYDKLVLKKELNSEEMSIMFAYVNCKRKEEN